MYNYLFIVCFFYFFVCICKVEEYVDRVYVLMILGCCFELLIVIEMRLEYIYEEDLYYLSKVDYLWICCCCFLLVFFSEENYVLKFCFYEVVWFSFVLLFILFFCIYFVIIYIFIIIKI